MHSRCWTESEVKGRQTSWRFSGESESDLERIWPIRLFAGKMYPKNLNSIYIFHHHLSSSAHTRGGKGNVPAVNILTMMHKSWTADTGRSTPNARQTVGKMNVDSRMKSESEFHIQARTSRHSTLNDDAFLVFCLLLFYCGHPAGAPRSSFNWHLH